MTGRAAIERAQNQALIAARQKEEDQRADVAVCSELTRRVWGGAAASRP